MVHLRGNRPVCHYQISALAGWMARVSLTSASCRLSLCLGDRPRRQPARRRRSHFSNFSSLGQYVLALGWAWYLEIARDGYRYEPGVPSSAAFFPLYPLLIRAIHALLLLPENDSWWLVIAIAISNVPLLIALTYFRALLPLNFGEDFISRPITNLLIFPTPFF